MDRKIKNNPKKNWSGSTSTTEIIKAKLKDLEKLTTSPDKAMSCLLYTSDAADDMQCVDLGGRRIIKKTVRQLVT